MSERFTQQAQRTLVAARFEAAQLGNSSIDPEHLLLGIYREGKGTTARIMSRAGVNLVTLREQLVGQHQFHTPVTNFEIPFGVGLQRLLRCAEEEADRLSSDAIGAEHLLLSILTEGSSTAARVLELVGLTAERVQAEIAALRPESANRDDDGPD